MRLSRRRAERLAPLLLMFGCWGFQSPSLRQGAVGTGYFEPGGLFFRDLTGPKQVAADAVGVPFRISPWPVTFGGPLEGAWIQASPQANGP
jgi:hypothetical protein